MNNESQCDFEDWGLIMPRHKRKMGEDWGWSIDLGHLYWQEILDQIKNLNKEGIYRLPTANELLFGLEEGVDLVKDVYWSATPGLYIPNSGMLDLITNFPTRISEEFSTLVDSRNGRCSSENKGFKKFFKSRFSRFNGDGEVVTKSHRARLLKFERR